MLLFMFLLLHAELTAIISSYSKIMQYLFCLSCEIYLCWDVAFLSGKWFVVVPLFLNLPILISNLSYFSKLISNLFYSILKVKFVQDQRLMSILKLAVYRNLFKHNSQTTSNWNIGYGHQIIPCCNAYVKLKMAIYYT